MPIPTAAEQLAELGVDVTRLPPWVQRFAAWVMTRWVGRFLLRAAGKCVKIELFDRSMAIAAQMFTSVFPLLIVLGSWLHLDNDAVADLLAVPDETVSVLDAAIGGDAEAATFGIVGALIVLISATSLSRALTRAYAAIWDLPRPKTRLKQAWRWASAVCGLAISLAVVRAMADAAEDLPRPEFWQVAVAAAGDIALGLFLPWILLAGAIRTRMLLPAAAIYALAMVPVRAASSIGFAHLLESSAAKYGSIGVAFTYIAWLYVVAFCLLVANILGNVLATDDSWFGRMVRGRGRPASEASPALVAEPPAST
jgi:membrane protein